jgi:UDP-N-acetylmuramoyl-L-alanyl-D-glutamate--2,6-diaminopimelate ligase
MDVEKNGVQYVPADTKLSQPDQDVRKVSSHSNDDAPSSNGKPRQVRTKNLSQVLNGIETVTSFTKSAEIHQIVCDSRKVRAGAIFFALRGAKENGQAFIDDAIQRGAVALVSDEPLTGVIPSGVTAIQVREARKALAMASANFYDHPGNALQLVAVTGTNGKTTTTSVIDAIIKASKSKTGLFGTIVYETPSGKYPAPNTTPESVDLQGFLAEIRGPGG